MERFKIPNLWLGWGPMTLSNETEIRAIEENIKTADPSDAPHETLILKRMDYYRNQILVINAFLTVLLSYFVIYFYYFIWKTPLSNARTSLLVGAIIGFTVGLYGTLNYRKKLFKEKRLTLGYKKSENRMHWIIYHFLKIGFLIVIYFSLLQFFASIDLFVATHSLAWSTILIQWYWYYDIKRWERKHDQAFIWKSKGWFQEFIIEPQEA